MALNLYDLVNAKPLAEYIEAKVSNTVPYLGATLFPATKIQGLSLEWLLGYDELPVSLAPSAFDSKAPIRDRIGVASINTQLPFFREATTIGEKQRQEILGLLALNNNQYIRPAIERIFDDSYRLVQGAEVVAERERISLLVDGSISISSDAKDSRVSKVAYNYDVDNKWHTNNYSTITDSAKKWSDTANSNPLQDILDRVRTAKNFNGTVLTRGIVSSKTWGYILANQNIKKAINPLGAANLIITPTDLRNFILINTGVTLTVYDKVYADKSGTVHQFYPDDYITLLPADTLGQTVYGTTPEEADLVYAQSGESSSALVQVVNTGVAITTERETHPVNIKTIVSALVLPSFPRIANVFTIKVA